MELQGTGSGGLLGVVAKRVPRGELPKAVKAVDARHGEATAREPADTILMVTTPSLPARWALAKFQGPGLADEVVAEAVVRLLLGEGEPELLVDSAR